MHTSELKNGKISMASNAPEPTFFQTQGASVLMPDETNQRYVVPQTIGTIGILTPQKEMAPVRSSSAAAMEAVVAAGTTLVSSISSMCIGASPIMAAQMPQAFSKMSLASMVAVPLVAGVGMVGLQSDSVSMIGQSGAMSEPILTYGATRESVADPTQSSSLIRTAS